MSGAAGPLETISASTLITGLALVGLACGVEVQAQESDDDDDGGGCVGMYMLGWTNVFSSPQRPVDRAVIVFPERRRLLLALVFPEMGRLLLAPVFPERGRLLLALVFPERLLLAPVFPERGRLLLLAVVMPTDPTPTAPAAALRGALFLFLPPPGGLLLLGTAAGRIGREAISDGARTSTASLSSSSDGSMLDSIEMLLESTAGGGRGRGGGVVSCNMWMHDWTVSLGGGMYISPNRGATSCWVLLLLLLLFRHNKVTRSMMRYRKELHSVR